MTKEDINKREIITILNFGFGYDEEDIIYVKEFIVEEGELILIIGPNESGKTTLCKLIAGIIEVDENTNETFDIPPDKPPVLVWQDDKLFPGTVKGNLAHVCSNEERIDYFLSKFDLRDKQQKPVHELSGGARKRLAIARALVSDPEAPVIFDEPTLSVDINYFDDIVEAITRVYSEEERATIVVTHDDRLFSELTREKWSPKIYTLEPFSSGREQPGSTLSGPYGASEFHDEPETLFWAKFAGYENIFSLAPYRKLTQDGYRISDFEALPSDWRELDRPAIVVPKGAIDVSTNRPDEDSGCVPVTCESFEHQSGDHRLYTFTWDPGGGAEKLEFRIPLSRNEAPPIGSNNYLKVDITECIEVKSIGQPNE